MLREWSQNVRKRREKQVRLIKQGMVPPVHHSVRSWAGEWETPREKIPEPAPWNRFVPEGEKVKRRERRLMFQVTAAAILLVFTFILFHSDSPALEPAEQFATEVMTRDFNFAGLSDWYKQYVGGNPAILPAFLKNDEPGNQQTLPQWRVPVKGKIILPFDEKRKGLVIRTAARAEVVAAAEGWVTFAGHKEGLGNTVIIRHAGGRETWYGWLQNLHVKERDWVKSGERIGEVGETKGQSLIYVAMKKDNQFVNPAGVIPLE
ncbi:M23 family metallopeptidase [Lihuaxuella thermophila]|uniref:Stage IV sporulation protein FA n=1 Tax=Lihuaxuella thermophila TaxID=1173111 RepID=A0A1H8FRQ0_9BACL|nr:M23 family metallopeptidase [Lihuaxuella thermophila]SEN34471.1 stage IV sporulation protein FA [Lihuaxuella thermophila]